MSIYDYKVKNRNGNVVARYSPIMKPEEMEDKIKELIGE